MRRHCDIDIRDSNGDPIALGDELRVLKPIPGWTGFVADRDAAGRDT